MITKCNARAKLTRNSKLGTYKVLVTFSHKEKFTQRDADYISGDLVGGTGLGEEVLKVLSRAAKVLRIELDNIRLVGANNA